MDISSLRKLRDFFNSGQTKPYEFRKEQLKKFKASILRHEQDLYDALRSDLNKSPRKLGNRTWTGNVRIEFSNQAFEKLDASRTSKHQPAQFSLDRKSTRLNSSH